MATEGPMAELLVRFGIPPGDIARFNKELKNVQKEMAATGKAGNTMGLAISQLGFAFQDFVQVSTMPGFGFAGGFRAATNNLQQILFLLTATGKAGIIASIGAATAGVAIGLVPKIWEAVSGAEALRDRFKEAAEAGEAMAKAQAGAARDAERRGAMDEEESKLKDLGQSFKKVFDNLQSARGRRAILGDLEDAREELEGLKERLQAIREMQRGERPLPFLLEQKIQQEEKTDPRARFRHFISERNRVENRIRELEGTEGKPGQIQTLEDEFKNSQTSEKAHQAAIESLTEETESLMKDYSGTSESLREFARSVLLAAEAYGDLTIVERLKQAISDAAKRIGAGGLSDLMIDPKEREFRERARFGKQSKVLEDAREAASQIEKFTAPGSEDRKRMAQLFSRRLLGGIGAFGTDLDDIPRGVDSAETLRHELQKRGVGIREMRERINQQFGTTLQERRRTASAMQSAKKDEEDELEGSGFAKVGITGLPDALSQDTVGKNTDKLVDLVQDIFQELLKPKQQPAVK